MSNMSYCRFRNTLGDLRDCRQANLDLHDDELVDGLSGEEAEAREDLLRLCANILADTDTELLESIGIAGAEDIRVLPRHS